MPQKPPEKILTMINEQFPETESKQIKAFVEHFYQSYSSFSDSSENTYGAIIDYWRFASEKQASESKLRVFNPQFQ